MISATKFQKIPQTASPKLQIELYPSGKLTSRLMLICGVDVSKDDKTIIIGRRKWNRRDKSRERAGLALLTTQQET